MSVPPLNLLRDPWLPVRRRSGASEVVSVADALGAHDDPVVALDWSRPDFDAAGLEFLIGLLSTIVPPGTTREWRARWDAPPDRDAVAALLEPYAAFFHLDGAGSRFLQDFGDLGDEASPISRLFIDQPGENALKENTDLFQKRGRIETIGRPAAAMALYTLQCFSPSGGKGHRTSLRGGGPLTTLIDILKTQAGTATLWQQVWINVLPPLRGSNAEPPILEAPERTFPWLAPTRTSDKPGSDTELIDIHPAQCFWGMPRRIRLHFEYGVDAFTCDATFRLATVAAIRSCTMISRGIKYSNIPHPFTPYYRERSDAGWLPTLARADKISWRHWPEYSNASNNSNSKKVTIASCIYNFSNRPEHVDSMDVGIRAHGYNMDQAKAITFIEARIPLFSYKSIQVQRFEFDVLIGRLAETASKALSILTTSLKEASGQRDGHKINFLRELFWVETEPAFRDAIEIIRGHVERQETSSAYFENVWIGSVLTQAALSTFDREIPLAPLLTSARVGRKQKGNSKNSNLLIGELGRAVEARRNLTSALRGFGKAGGELFTAAGLAPPAGVAKSKAKPKKGAAQ